MGEVISLQTARNTSRRRYERIRMPVDIEMAGRTWTAEDWSVGGFRIAETEAECAGDADHHVVLRLTVDGWTYAFRLLARRVHRDEAAGASGYQFLGMSDPQLDLIRALIVEQVSGGVFPLFDLVTNARTKDALQLAMASGRYTGLGTGLDVDITRA